MNGSLVDLAKKLIPFLPEDWGAFVDGDVLRFRNFVDWAGKGVRLNDKSETPWFMNWLLDEIAKMGARPELTYAEDGWYVRYYVTNTDSVFTDSSQTKTRVLIQAYLELKSG